MKIASRWFKSLLNHFLTHSAACASCYLNWFLFDCFCSHQWAEAFLSYDHYISRFFFFGSGSHLSSHTVASIVLSAVLVLTVVFGMGTGVTPKRIATGSFLLLLFVQSIVPSPQPTYVACYSVTLLYKFCQLSAYLSKLICIQLSKFLHSLWQLDSNATPYFIPVSLERRWSSRRFSYGYLVTTSPQLSDLPSTALSMWPISQAISFHTCLFARLLRHSLLT